MAIGRTFSQPSDGCTWEGSFSKPPLWWGLHDWRVVEVCNGGLECLPSRVVVLVLNLFPWAECGSVSY